MPFSLILDIAVAILLIVTIGYAIKLNKRLTRLRGDKKDLENLARTFGESTKRAEDNINHLRTIAQALDIQMQRAQSLRDDLAFLADRGGSTADHLESLVREARDGLGIGPKPTGSSAMASVEHRKSPTVEPRKESARDKSATGRDGIEPRSEAERELLRALRDAG